MSQTTPARPATRMPKANAGIRATPSFVSSLFLPPSRRLALATKLDLRRSMIPMPFRNTAFELAERGYRDTRLQSAAANLVHQF